MRKRFGMVLERFWSGIGQAIPFACQDWSSTKAAYRFLSNERGSEQEILSGHFHASAERLRSTLGPILILQDTTTFSYQRERPELIGYTGKMAIKRGKNGSLRPLTQCGILMHSSLVVTAEGLPLGLAAVKFWTRSRFKGTTALKRHVNPTRVPIEEKESYRWLENMRQSTALLGDPVRCIHVGDRESDIYELFCTAYDLSTYFLVRTCVDRLAGDGHHTIADEMEQVKVKGLHRVEIRDAKGHPMTVTLELRYQRMTQMPNPFKRNLVFWNPHFSRAGETGGKRMISHGSIRDPAKQFSRRRSASALRYPAAGEALDRYRANHSLRQPRPGVD